MELHVTLEGRRDLTGQVYRQIRAAIFDGRLARGDRLPPSRELAQRLAVARNTIALAYDWLSAEGLVDGRGAAGTFVATAPPPRGRPPRRARVNVRPLWRTLDVPPPPGPGPAYDFDAGVPDARLFPYDAWRTRMARASRATALPATYGDPAGHPQLRAAIAHHVGVARGVRAAADDVVVTNGAQQALDLLARVLLEPGARVAVEDPGYPPAQRLFRSLGADVCPVRVDADGLDVAALPADARLVYVTPSHQFPLGMPMALARRRALLAWATRRDAVVIEDDYDSEFRFGGRPLDTLHALDRDGRVAYVGSFSKVMLPALRLGFVIAPAPLRRALAAAAAVSGWHAAWPAQGALARFITDGELARHVRKMRREYARRHARVLAALARDCGAWLAPIASACGLHLTAMLRGANEREVTARALGHGVRVGRLSPHYLAAPARGGLVLGYGAIAADRIDDGVRRLRAALAATARQ